MASYKAVAGFMTALEGFFKERFPEELAGGDINARVLLLGSTDFSKTDLGNLLGLYLHRVTLDGDSPGRYSSPVPAGNREPTPVLPLKLHFLLFSRAANPGAEATLMAWGMQQMAAFPLLGAGRIQAVDPSWPPHQQVVVAPDEMSSDELMGIWDALPAKYTLSAPYIARTLPIQVERPEPAVETVKSVTFKIDEGVDG